MGYVILREQVVAVTVEQARPMSASELQREHIQGSQQGSIRDALQEAVEAEQLSLKEGGGPIPHMYAPLGYEWPK